VIVRLVVPVGVPVVPPPPLFPPPAFDVPPPQLEHAIANISGPSSPKLRRRLRPALGVMRDENGSAIKPKIPIELANAM
jgi:hypothetical protein